jgi:hypothetical protein
MVHMLYRPCTDDEKSLFRPSTALIPYCRSIQERHAEGYEKSRP